MKKILVIGAGIGTCLFLLLLLTLFTLPQVGSPQYQGELPLGSLKEKVSVHYDKWGIPHIEAANEEDLYQALGFVMAQDRILQMDLIRRLARGRLAELIGEKGLPSDQLFRTLALTENYQRQKKLGLLDPQVEKLVAAFVKGINGYIAQDKKPFEYFLLGGKPEEFSVEDSYSILGYMAYSFAMGLKADLFYEKLHRQGNGVGDDLRAFPAKKRLSFKETLFYKANQFAEDSVGLFTGSNAWLLSGERTLSKAPLLASDPHVRFSSPGLWYEAHLKSPEGEYYGHFVPALPFAPMAHNEFHGWGVTISYIDDMDFIYEKINDDFVISRDGQTKLEKREQIIKVKGEEDQSFVSLWTPRGPLIDGVLKRALKGKEDFLPLKENQRLSMHWGHYSKENQAMKTLYYALKAKTVKDFEKAMTFAGSPGLNLLYAHKSEKHIARYIVGTVYEREGVFSRRVSEGRELFKDPSKHWKKVPFSKRPHLKNPTSGIIVSANQKPEGTDDQFAGYFHPGDRYHTIHHLLEGKESWGIEGMRLVQTANTNVFFFSHRDRIKAAILPSSLSVYEREVMRWLKEWDGISPATSSQALIYYKFIEIFRRKAFKELSDDDFFHYCTLNDFSFALFRRLYEEAYEKEIEISFKAAVAILKKSYGEDYKKWQLGSEHQLTFPHPLGKASPILAKIFDHGPYPIDGGFHQINHQREIGCESGLKVEAGPSTRRLITFSKPTDSLGILPMGNSGHRTSPFLFNQWKTYAKSDYRPQIFRELKKEEVFGKLILYPNKK